MRAGDSFWRVFDRLINEGFPTLKNVVLAGDFLAITMGGHHRQKYIKLK